MNDWDEWVSLYKCHRKLRDEVGDSLESDLRSRLIELAKRGHCLRNIQGRFTSRRCGPLEELYIRPIGGAPQGSEALTGLAGFATAQLTLLALCNPRTNHLHQFTAMLSGLATDGTARAIAVHLEDDSEDDMKGDGACSHAPLHCHVGPTLDALPKVRVPLPPISPLAAFDWLLSMGVPGWETAPWDAVRRALEEEEGMLK